MVKRDERSGPEDISSSNRQNAEDIRLKTHAAGGPFSSKKIHILMYLVHLLRVYIVIDE